MGNGDTIKPGDVQLMSAGSGVRHSEFNGSESEDVHFLQIWIMPNVENESPDYQQKSFDRADMSNRFRVVVSPDGQEGSLKIKQDARMLVGKFDEDTNAEFATVKGRKYWVQVVQGIVEINGEKSSVGDGLAITGEDIIVVKSVTDSEILLFDLPY